jgi:hypothetical protein
MNNNIEIDNNLTIDNNLPFDNIKNNIFNIVKETINTNCPHFNNNIEIYAECCDKFFNCNKCHNNVCKNKIYNKEIKKIRCKICKTLGIVGKQCIGCNITFGKSSCLKCNIWSNNNEKIYHCDKCKCCRNGNKDDYFHCDKCNLCLSINCKDNHTCFKYDKDVDCPICLDKIFKTGDDIIILKCNHLLHKICYNNLIKNADENKTIPKCTLCKKSAVNFKQYETKYDNHVKNYPMPEYYNNWKSEILCNDCSEKSTVKYHKDYEKCKLCKSYNTYRVNIIK